jgi:hypothetical protein
MTTSNMIATITAHSYQGCKHSLGYSACYNRTHPCSGLSHPRRPSINTEEDTLGLGHTLGYTLVPGHTLGYTRHIG